MIKVDPERSELVAEMHLRPIPVLGAPSRLVQVLVLVDQKAAAEMLAYLVDHDLARPVDATSRHHSCEIAGALVMWERHTEALTLTAVLPQGIEPASAAAIECTFENVPGRILRAIKIDIVNNPKAAQRLVAELDMQAAATVAGTTGAITFWSDFKLRPSDGYGHLVVQSADSRNIELGRVVRDLQELGNYRNLALLGLPMVRRMGSVLSELEQETLTATARLIDRHGDRSLLDDLTQLSARLARLRAEVAFRLGASEAYGEIVNDRLKALDPVSVGDFQTLEEFTNRRFLPALRTCENFGARIDALAQRIEQAVNLLRARVDVALNEQNADVLQSLDATSRRQLKLQHLVEGLSVFAIAYYAIGLLSYLLGVVPKSALSDKQMLIGWLVIPIYVGLALSLRRQRR